MGARASGRFVQSEISRSLGRVVALAVEALLVVIVGTIRAPDMRGKQGY